MGADDVKVAAAVKERLRDQKTMLLNLLPSPGSGKTGLILKTAGCLAGGLRPGVIEADIDSTAE